MCPQQRLPLKTARDLGWQEGRSSSEGALERALRVAAGVKDVKRGGEHSWLKAQALLAQAAVPSCTHIPTPHLPAPT